MSRKAKRKALFKKDPFDPMSEEQKQKLAKLLGRRLEPIPGQAGEFLKQFGIQNVGDLENELFQLGKETSSPEEAAKLLSRRLVEKAYKKTTN